MPLNMAVSLKQAERKMGREELLHALAESFKTITTMELYFKSQHGHIHFEGDYLGYGFSPTVSLRFKNLLKELSDVTITEKYLSSFSISIQFLSLDVLALQIPESLYSLLYTIFTEHGEEAGVWYPACVGRKITVKSYFFTHFEKFLTLQQKFELESTFGPFVRW